MGKILLIILGIVILIVCIPIILGVLESLFALAFTVALFIVVVGGAFLILRKIFSG